VACAFGEADYGFAHSLYVKDRPRELIERVILLGCLRRIISGLNSNAHSLILDFLYFENVISEVEHADAYFREKFGGPAFERVSAGYWIHVRKKYSQLGPLWLRRLTACRH